MYGKEKHEVEINMSYDIEITIKLGKALLVDTKTEPKKLLRNLEGTMFYKIPSMDKCVVSELHKQDFEKNDGRIIVRNLVIDQDEWISPQFLVRSKIMDIPLQSLFFSLLNYRHNMEKYFYLPPSKEIVEKREQFCTISINNFEFVHLQSLKGEHQPLNLENRHSSFERKFVADYKGKDSPNEHIRNKKI